ncbi:MAG TPA: PLP-dependent aspartate aminotransferase family protein [Hyphomicrobiaceae bacterium]|nr:PLP-dependent aspartate aminotransferase family protein [Hyphomicrobiaceae bacterium]
MSDRKNRLAPATIAAQANHHIDPETGAVVPALDTSTTFARGAGYALLGDYEYARDTNPTTTMAEKVLAEISSAPAALLFNSGMSAITAVFETLRTGQHVVAPEIMYHGAKVWLRRLAELRGVEVSFFDQTENGVLARALRPGRTAIVWIESPTNPTWDVIDIHAAATAAHAVGAILAVDCTVAPPCTTDAITLGADIVFHSATKYLGGHSDLTAGALVTANEDDRWDEIARVRTLTGGIISPFDAWLLVRGIRTLFVRYERASENAMRIARHFDSHPAIERVLYPGLESHPRHAVAKSQMTGGYGGMLSLLIRGDAAAGRRVSASVKVFIPATSLGGVESLIEHRKSIEGPDSLVPENLLRLSIGIESADDLIADLEQAVAFLQ